MNKKILIGCIIGVTILVGVSFTSAVGYNSVRSSSRITSPLFGIRTRRAIGRVEKDISTDYLGHGEKTNIHISNRLQRAEQVQKAIDIFSKMDYKAFRELVARIINKEQMEAKETIDALKTFNHIRENPDDINYYDTKNSPIDETSGYVSCRWWPGCNIFNILVVIASSIIGFITSLFNCYPLTSAGACPTVGCPL